jgi:hypothetical protein
MKGIGFTFYAFGQWSEHDRSMMKWQMKIRIEWRPSMAGHLLPPFPSTISLLAQSPHLWDRMEGLWPHVLAPGHHPWPADHPLAPL